MTLERNLSRSEIESNISNGAPNSDSPSIVLDSFSLFLDVEDKSVAYCLERDGHWESWITSWMTHNIKEEWVCLDIGANFGYYTGVLQYLGKEVHGFEPNPNIYNLLCHSKTWNRWKNVSVYPVALGEKSGDGVLTMNSHLKGSASLLLDREHFSRYGDDIDEIDVAIATLDGFEIKPHFAKIDAEGFEPQIFEGGKETLANCEIILVEITKEHPLSFIEHLFENWNVTAVNYDGGEDQVDPKIVSTEDWMMLVLRRKM